MVSIQLAHAAGRGVERAGEVSAMKSKDLLKTLNTRYSLRRLLVVPVVFGCALAMWRIAPVDSVEGIVLGICLFVAAAFLCAAILLAGRGSHYTVFVKALGALVVGLATTTVLDHYISDSPIVFPVALGSAAVGWAIAGIIAQRLARKG